MDVESNRSITIRESCTSSRLPFRIVQLRFQLKHSRRIALAVATCKGRRIMWSRTSMTWPILLRRVTVAKQIAPAIQQDPLVAWLSSCPFKVKGIVVEEGLRRQASSRSRLNPRRTVHRVEEAHLDLIPLLFHPCKHKHHTYAQLSAIPDADRV